MKMPKVVRVILKDQAKEAYEMLCKVVEEQKGKGRTNSEEIQLLKSINKKVELLKYNQAYGQGIAKEQIPKGLDVNNLFRIELTRFIAESPRFPIVVCMRMSCNLIEV